MLAAELGQKLQCSEAKYIDCSSVGLLQAGKQVCTSCQCMQLREGLT